MWKLIRPRAYKIAQEIRTLNPVPKTDGKHLPMHDEAKQCGPFRNPIDANITIDSSYTMPTDRIKYLIDLGENFLEKDFNPNAVILEDAGRMPSYLINVYYSSDNQNYTFVNSLSTSNISSSLYKDIDIREFAQVGQFRYWQIEVLYVV